jgi:DNA-binding NarL/FixJ family response regulator
MCGQDGDHFPRMNTLKTYIVEDSVTIRDSLIATLQELTTVEVVGFAEDEDTATAWLSNPDNDARLVIVDLFLKQGSGLGVLQSAAIHAGRRKWVVFSNYATPAIRSLCLALGADRLFDKSTEIDGLIAYCNRMAEDDASTLGALS